MRLDELLAANQAVMTVYVLKNERKDLWRQPTRHAAATAWAAWRDKALGGNRRSDPIEAQVGLIR